METFDGAPAPSNPMDPAEVLARASSFDPTQRITVIPTTYKGYSMRSRTEARWGVFLDAMGIAWEYEPEGLALTDGTRYLPDFFLPRFRWFAEVKPTDGIFKAEDKSRIVGLTAAVPILFLIGPPDFKAYRGVDGGFDDGLTFSLDIHNFIRATAEDRLYSCPSYETGGDCFSDEYQTAVYLSRAERFGC